ncbi:putative sulfate exporter family transporter [Apibacter raozihei]|uniref:YeiH family protein n=1 Tax=Apibacter TaxID=1778601 RepID=UPI000FE29E12|nr:MULTISPECIES: putative sulfate exporter family transporter [Apibacter]
MKNLKLTEDWTATVIGGLLLIISIILFSVNGYVLSWPSFKWNTLEELSGNVLTFKNLLTILLVFVVTYLAVVLAFFLQGKSLNSSKGFPVLFFLTVIAMVVGGNGIMNDWGIESVIFCLLIGLFINNFIGTPDWLKGILLSELYVKIGLIFLGATIIFQDIMKAGALGLIQSVIVVFSVWYFAFWLCKKFKIDQEMSMMLSSAVSICGVSAAIATAGAIKGDSKKLSYVVSLVLVVAVPMIIIMPALAKLLGLNEVMAGAWIGGTIDTTGAVAATGAVYGEEALKISSIVKFSQNVLLGIAAFLIAVYWSYAKKDGNEYADKPNLKVIWERFPKFVLGFVAASLLFSFALPTAEFKPVIGTLKKFQGLWFALGFTAIGLETNFKTLINSENRKATYVFLGAQTFNVVFTLIVAYLVFGIQWD